MRLVRTIVTALIALSLAVLPVAAAATPHVGKAEVMASAAGDDCPCCNAAHKCPSDTCVLKCYAGPALLITHAVAPRPERALPGPTRTARLPALTPHPEPPPPRS